MCSDQTIKYFVRTPQETEIPSTLKIIRLQKLITTSQSPRKNEMCLTQNLTKYILPNGGSIRNSNYPLVTGGLILGIEGNCGGG